MITPLDTSAPGAFSAGYDDDGTRAQYFHGQPGLTGFNPEASINLFDPQGNLNRRVTIQSLPDVPHLYPGPNDGQYTLYSGVHDTTVYDAFGKLRGTAASSVLPGSNNIATPVGMSPCPCTASAAPTATPPTTGPAWSA